MGAAMRRGFEQWHEGAAETPVRSVITHSAAQWVLRPVGRRLVTCIPGLVPAGHVFTSFLFSGSNEQWEHERRHLSGVGPGRAPGSMP